MKVLFIIFFLNIFENNFYMVLKRASNEKKTLYSTSMQNDMPQSLLVFAVSFTTEASNYGMFGGVAHPP